jgi:hypothetical protein
MRWFALAVFVMLAAGCAVFEQTPEDMQNKLGNATKGQLYECDPLGPQ